MTLGQKPNNLQLRFLAGLASINFTQGYKNSLKAVPYKILHFDSPQNQSNPSLRELPNGTFLRSSGNKDNLFSNRICAVEVVSYSQLPAEHCSFAYPGSSTNRGSASCDQKGAERLLEQNARNVASILRFLLEEAVFRSKVLSPTTSPGVYHMA